jgi:hypothetical protein
MRSHESDSRVARMSPRDSVAPTNRAMAVPYLRFIGGSFVLLCSAWACKPDLDALTAEWSGGAGGAGGTAGSAGFANGGTGETSGKGGSQNVSGTAGNGESGSGAGADSGGEGGEGGVPPNGGKGGVPTAGTDNGGQGGVPEPPASCDNDEIDSDETDVDCGGASDCERCRDNRQCVLDGDCQSGVCKGMRCAAPTCEDGHHNQDETAIDCGGTCAPERACEIGSACREDQDCQNQICKNAVCTHHCASTERDADETDVDCGGAECDACGDTLQCATPDDCVSKVCTDQVCQPATCSDGVINQNESDQDCGGVCTPTKYCALDQSCNGPADCASYVCTETRCVPDTEVLAEDVIDDFEDRNMVVGAVGGRIGNWYPYGDGTGTFVATEVTTIIGQRGPTSLVGLHTAGSGFTSWGSGMGVDINNAGGSQSTKLPYDASAYTGISFWARSEVGGTVTLVLPDENTDPSGPTCVVCDHHFLKVVSLTTTWQRYTVLFDELVLEPGGDPVPEAFASGGIVSVQFRFNAGATYDLWVDDISFVR